MPKPCPRCGLENTNEAVRCSRCDAPLREPTAISPAFRRFLLWLGAFAIITAAGVLALVYVHETAVPLGDPVVPRVDRARQEETFEREQAIEAPPPAGHAGAPAVFPGLPAPTAPGPTPPAPGAPQVPGQAAGAPAASDASSAPGSPDALLGEEDVTAQMPPVPSSGIDWNREILPPTGRPTPSGPQAGAPPAYPESGSGTSFPPIVPPSPGTAPANEETGAAGQGDATGTPTETSSPAVEPPPAPTGAAPAGSPAPSPGGQARRLAEVQEERCAREGFLTRFACRERVRLAYCENRWNQHPDCMVENNATSY